MRLKALHPAAQETPGWGSSAKGWFPASAIGREAVPAAHNKAETANTWFTQTTKKGKHGAQIETALQLTFYLLPGPDHCTDHITEFFLQSTSGFHNGLQLMQFLLFYSHNPAVRGPVLCLKRL